MLNHYSLWKNSMILLVLLAGLIYALPNLFGDNPAVQVSSSRGETLGAGTEEKIERLLSEKGVAAMASEVAGGRLTLRFADEEAQLTASDLLQQGLGNNFTVALNLAPATPDWLRSFNALPMFLGLDLRGGVHFLMQVDMVTAVDQTLERYLGDVRLVLRKDKIRYRSISKQDGLLSVTLRDLKDFEKAVALINKEYPQLEERSSDADTATVTFAISEQEQRETKEFALQQNILTLRNRVNELGVAEPVIQRQGEDRIVVQLPGVQDTARAKDILGATATLEFRMVDTDNSAISAASGRAPAGSRLYRERNGSPVLLKRRVIVTGDQITDASSGLEQNSNTPAVFISLDGKGARKMGNITRDNIGKPMAVVFIEDKVETTVVDGKRKETVRRVEEVINIATIRGQFSNRFQISGLDSTTEARNLSLLLRAGALAAPVRIVEERTVGPSLGKDNIQKGFASVLIGFVLVLIFMLVYYKVFGIAANIALTFNLVLLIALLSIMQATLTLPGIAGIVLTVGMAVDANVLIFERIKEELKNGNTPQASIHAGFEKAFSTIADANITTLIAAVVLFSFGTGPIKGFAITLSIGILTSMFTSIVLSRGVINLVYGGRNVKKLAI